MTDTSLILQGINTAGYLRLLKNQSTQEGQLIPFRTSLTFDPKRDSKSTETSDGSLPKNGSLTASIKFDMLKSISAVSDDIEESLYDNEKAELWIVNLDRVNSTGAYYGYYVRGYVSELSNTASPDDYAKVSVTFSVEGTPQRGWVQLPEDAKAQINYVFRGIDKVTDDSGTGNGTAFNDVDDRGKGTNPKKSTGKDATGKGTGDPKDSSVGG